MKCVLATGVVFAAITAAPCAFAAADPRGEDVTFAMSAEIAGDAAFSLSKAKAPEAQPAASDYAARETAPAQRDSSAAVQRDRTDQPREERRRRRGLPGVPDSVLMDPRGAL